MAVYPLDSAVKTGSPHSEKLQMKTLIGDAGLESTEYRKRKRIFPRRQLKLVYPLITKVHARSLWAFYILRGGSYEAFTYFYPRSELYVKEYVGLGDGSTVSFDTPSLDGTDVVVYVDNSLESGANYTFTQEAGTDGGDDLTFNSAPSNGEVITLSFSGYLRMRARFAEDNLDFDSFYRVLATTGLTLQGLKNDE